MAWSNKYKGRNSDRYASRVVIKTPEEREREFEEKLQDAINRFKTKGMAFVIVERGDRDRMIRRMYAEFPDDITLDEKDYWKEGKYHQLFTKIIPIRPELVVGQPVAVYYGVNEEGNHEYYAGVVSERDEYEVVVDMNNGKKEVIKIEELPCVVTINKVLQKDTPYTHGQIGRVRIP